jgi:hypothetical protein
VPANQAVHNALPTHQPQVLISSSCPQHPLQTSPTALSALARNTPVAHLQPPCSCRWHPPITARPPLPGPCTPPVTTHLQCQQRMVRLAGLAQHVFQRCHIRITAPGALQQAVMQLLYGGAVVPLEGEGVHPGLLLVVVCRGGGAGAEGGVGAAASTGLLASAAAVDDAGLLASSGRHGA